MSFLHLLKRSNAAIPFSAESAAKIGGMNILIFFTSLNTNICSSVTYLSIVCSNL